MLNLILSYQSYMIYVAPFRYFFDASGMLYGAYAYFYANRSALELDVHKVDIYGISSLYAYTLAFNYYPSKFHTRIGMNYSTIGNYVMFAGLKYVQPYLWNAGISVFYYRVGDANLKAIQLHYGRYMEEFYLGVQLNLTNDVRNYIAYWINLSYGTYHLFSIFAKFGEERFPVRNEGFYLLDMPQDSLRGFGVGAYLKYVVARNFAIHGTAMLETYASETTMRRGTSNRLYIFLSLGLGYSRW